MLAIRGISKIFNTGTSKPRTALQNVSLEFEAGDIVGFLGPNGSGKSTLIKLIAGLVYPDTGEIGYSGSKKPTVSVVLDGGRSLYWRLTVAENLKYLCYLRNTPTSRVTAMIQRFGLEPLADTLAGQLSTGQKQRVALAAAFLSDPDIIILDEPTNGLDFAWVENFCTTVEETARQFEGLIIVATHDTDLVKRLCNRVAIFSQGQVVASGSIADLQHILSLRRYRITLQGEPGQHVQSWLQKRRSSQETTADKTSIVVDIGDPHELFALVEAVKSDNCLLLGLESLEADIGAAYRNLVQREAV